MFARLFLPFLLLATVAVPARAQERETPYWASIRATVLNMRVGPSADYKIDWVYRRPGLPVKVVRVMEGWRLIEDPDGARGWVVARLLSPERGAIVIGEGLADMRAGDSADDTLPSPLADETPVNDPYRDDDAGADAEKQDCNACFFLSIF